MNIFVEITDCVEKVLPIEKKYFDLDIPRELEEGNSSSAKF